MRRSVVLVVLVLCGLGLIGYSLVDWEGVAARYYSFSPEAQAAEDSASARAYQVIRAQMDSARAASPSDEVIGAYALCEHVCPGDHSGAAFLVLMPEEVELPLEDFELRPDDFWAIPRDTSAELINVGTAPPNGCYGLKPLRWSREPDGTVKLGSPMEIDAATTMEVVMTEEGALGYEEFSGIIGRPFTHYRMVRFERVGPARADACRRPPRPRWLTQAHPRAAEPASAPDGPAGATP